MAQQIALQEKVDFGVWVPLKIIIIPLLLTLVFLGLGLIHWVFLVFAGLFLIITVYFAVARHLFSASDSLLQRQIQSLLIDHINWDGSGEILDIGCGNGPLTIALAKKYPGAKVVGMDYWGKDWDYSKQVCERNASLSNVAQRTIFRPGSAVELPFPDNSFDLVVSNLVFHEVRGASDKRELIKEALRVLRPGGSFVFQDLFLLQSYFGTPEELVDLVKGWGTAQVEFIKTCDEPFIPKWVKLPFMVGALAVLRGVK